MIDFGEHKWTAVSDAFAERIGKSTMPLSFRVWACCLAAVNNWGHAYFAPGELSRLVYGPDRNPITRGMRNTVCEKVRQFKAERWVAEESVITPDGPACIVMDFDICQRGAGRGDVREHRCLVPGHAGYAFMHWSAEHGWSAGKDLKPSGESLHGAGKSLHETTPDLGSLPREGLEGSEGLEGQEHEHAPAEAGDISPEHDLVNPEVMGPKSVVEVNPVVEESRTSVVEEDSSLSGPWGSLPRTEAPNVASPGAGPSDQGAPSARKEQGSDPFSVAKSTKTSGHGPKCPCGECAEHRKHRAEFPEDWNASHGPVQAMNKYPDCRWCQERPGRLLKARKRQEQEQHKAEEAYA